MDAKAPGATVPGATEPDVSAPEPGAGAPCLWLSLAGGIVVDADDQVAALVGVPSADLIGRPLELLWAPRERRAIAARLDDAVLLGRDRIGALALQRPSGGPVWVELEARFDHRAGERLAVRLLRVPRLPVEQEAAEVPPGGASAAGPGAEGPAPGPHGQRRGVADAAAGDWAEGELSGLDAAESAAASVLATLEATGAAALHVGRDGLVGGATQAVERLIGRTPAELRGLGLGDVLDLPETARQALETARAQGVRQSVLASAAGRDGQMVVEWVPGPEPGTGYVALAAPGRQSGGDTERIRLQARLISHVAHDLRGALASVYAGLQTLVDDLAPDTDQHETAAKSLAQVQRASRIVEEVLALSRPGRLRRAELAVSELIEAIAEGQRAGAELRGVELELRLADGLLVSVDRSNLEAAFVNLVENALRAMPEGGRLTLTVEDEERSAPGALVSIADTGVGIRPELQSSIFEPFVSDSPGGSGLGLTIARQVVLAHGGQIDFVSRPGEGTTFRVWLPRID